MRLTLLIATLFMACSGRLDLPPQQQDEIHQPFSATWVRVGGGCFTDIAFWGSTMIGLGCADVDSLHDKVIKVRLANGTWTEHPGAATSLSSDGFALVAVSGSGAIWRWDVPSQNWQHLPGTQGVGRTPNPGVIAIYGNVTYVISTDAQVYQFVGVSSPPDGSQSYWAPLQPQLSSFVGRISTNSTHGVTAVTSACSAASNLLRHSPLPANAWTTVGQFGGLGCFRDATVQLPGSINFEQVWAVKGSDGIPRQLNNSDGNWLSKPLPASAAPFNTAARLVGDNANNRVLALGPPSDPQGNLWINQ